ncbi:MAG: tetratricopeptide repeat protein, partial [Myxococcota bacterium]
FETLVDQQGASTDRPEFAKTYWWLGNLYDQQGRSDDARVAWEKGLALFPGDPTLIGKLAARGGSR